MRKAVLFDIDGTLLDAQDFVFDAIKHAITTHGYYAPTDQTLRKNSGKTLVEIYRVILPEADSALLAKAHREFQEVNFRKIKPFPKAKKTLKILKKSGFLIGAVSNRMRGSLLRSLKFSEIFDYFDVIVSADDVVNPKPHPDHLSVALKKLGVEPNHAYMVGDTHQDILAGKNSGIKTVGVTYGFVGTEIKKYNPDFIIDDIEELLNIL